MDVLNLKFHSQQINTMSSLLNKYEPQGYRSMVTAIAPDVENVLNEYRDFLIVFRKYDTKNNSLYC
jgi:hypothetical protein